MHGSGEQFIGLSALAMLLVAPLILGLLAIVWRSAGRPLPTEGSLQATRTWPIIINSTVMYVIAFNVVFFIQELFLVIPKALYPGLRPTLYHNNHGWEGDAPIAQLFQGTGALAILIVGLLALTALSTVQRSASQWRLLLFWIAHQGLVQALPQVPSGLLDPETDVGDAMNYLGMPISFQMMASIAALIAMAGALFLLSGSLQGFAPSPSVSRSSKPWFAIKSALVPALLAVPIIALYRAPQEDLGELLLPQVMFALMGTPWLVGAAWISRAPVSAPNDAAIRVDWKPFILAALLLAVFQLVLAPGVPFY